MSESLTLRHGDAKHRAINDFESPEPVKIHAPEMVVGLI